MFSQNTKHYSGKTFKAIDFKSFGVEETVFEGCHFIQCIFEGVHLKKCTFIECDFNACNLSLIDLGDSQFSDVVFDKSKLLGVDWCKAKWPLIPLNCPVQFYHCTLNESNFFGLSLSQALFEDCQVHNADFRESDLSYSSFQSCDLAGSLFQKTNLVGANFSEAVHYQIDPSLNCIKKAKFSFPEVVQLLAPLDIEILGLDDD